MVWTQCIFPSLYPRHTELVLTTFRTLLPNGLKLCSNWVDVVATFYTLFTNFMNVLERDGCSRTLSLIKSFCRPSHPVIRRSDNVLKTRWTYYKRNCRTSILLGTCYDVVQSGINWQYVCKPTHSFVARLPRSQTGQTRPYCVLSTLLFRSNAFKTKTHAPNKFATCFYTVLKVRSRFLVRFTRLQYVSVVLTQFLRNPLRLQYNHTSYCINTRCFLSSSSFGFQISDIAHLFFKASKNYE